MKCSFNMAVILCASTILLNSCGKGGGAGGGGPAPNTPVKSPISSNCFNLSGKNTVKEIALEANRARVECSLSEEEIVAHINRQ